jgi:cytochrome c6
MKNWIKLSIISAFVLSALFVLTTKTNLVNAESANSSAMSKKLYLQNCARCHGADGSSNTQVGRDMEAPPINGVSVARTVKVVTNGDGEMPAFKKKLTKAQIASIAKYVKGM